MEQSELNEILASHLEWVLDKGGRRAYLRGADLRGANLFRADLRGANLRGADLQDADLRGANLRDADLRDADLRDADLQDADLQDADLQDADLQGAVGNMMHVKSMQIERYSITYTADVLQIGCQRHSIEGWFAFDDKQIRAMDGRDAMAWWHKWRSIIKQIIENSPAKPTGGNHG